MNHVMQYSNRMPKKSEFTVSNYLIAILILTLMMIVYILKYYPDIKSFIAFLVIFFYIGFAATAKSMKSILIKKIESTIKENREISQNNPHLGLYLLNKSIITPSFYRGEMRYFWVGMLILFSMIGISYSSDIQRILSTYYISYIYICIWISLFTFKRLDDVFNYFQAINKNFTEKANERKNYISLHLESREYIDYFQKYQWLKINKVSLICCVVFIMIVSFTVKLEPFQFLMIISFSGLIFLWMNMRFLNKQLNIFLPIIGKYDEFIKGEMGLSYKPEKDDKGYSEFADELNKDIKDIFR